MNNYSPELSGKLMLKRYFGKMVDAHSRPAREPVSVRVLIYHNITDRLVKREWTQMTTPRSLFDEQMSYLKSEGYKVVPAEDVRPLLASGSAIPDRVVSITFDDGYKDNYRNAFPVLSGYGFKGTVFMTTGYIGRTGGGFSDCLDKEEIRQMSDSGVFTFGSHSVSHANLSRLDKEGVRREVALAKSTLEDLLSRKVTVFAYPYGWQDSFNDDVIDAVKGAGYESAFTGIHGANTRSTDLFRLMRMRVSWTDCLEDFKRMLNGSYDWYSIYQGIVSICKR